MASCTPRQIDTLRLILCGQVSMALTGHGSYRIVGAAPSVVGRLISMKLARWPRGPVGEQICELLPAGADVLANAGGAP